MDDNSLMPFGKYKDVALVNIPPEYLLLLYDNSKDKTGDVFEYIKENLTVLKYQVDYKKRSSIAYRKKDGKYINFN